MFATPRTWQDNLPLPRILFSWILPWRIFTRSLYFASFLVIWSKCFNFRLHRKKMLRSAIHPRYFLNPSRDSHFECLFSLFYSTSLCLTRYNKTVYSIIKQTVRIFRCLLVSSFLSELKITSLGQFAIYFLRMVLIFTWCR